MVFVCERDIINKDWVLCLCLFTLLLVDLLLYFKGGAYKRKMGQEIEEGGNRRSESRRKQGEVALQKPKQLSS